MANVACVCCEEVGAKLLARCLSCEGFLCEKGIESHKTMKFLKNHEVVNLEDLQSGKVNLSSVLAKQPTCDDHKGQPLWFYCDTCGVLVCQACTVVNHKSPDHVYVELKSAIKKQKRDIQQLIERSDPTSRRINSVLEETRFSRDNLAANAKNAASDIDNAVQSAIDQIQKLGKAQKDKLAKWVADSQSTLQITEETLLSQQAQLKRAQEMATQVLETGSDYDVASVYKQLKTSLKESGSVELTLPEPGQDQVVFRANLVTSCTQSLGTLTLGVRKVLAREWVLEKKIGHDGQVKMKDPRGVTITPSGDIAVAHSTPVQIYSTDGVFKRSLDKRSTGACNVVALDNGRLFVTTRNNKCVTTYNSEGQYFSEFSAVSPDGVKSSDEKTELSGLAVSRQNQLLVGEITRSYISIHNFDGNHISSIKAPVKPFYMCTTNQGNIVVSPNDEENVYVIDMDGNQLTVIKAPHDVGKWYPCGVCVSFNDEICIANFGGEDRDVYCFTPLGQYLGCIYKGLVSPEGMTLMDNDQKLLVAEGAWDASKITILSAK